MINKRVRTLGIFLSTCTILFELFVFIPLLFDALKEPPEGVEVWFAISQLILLIFSILSLGLFLPRHVLSSFKLIRYSLLVTVPLSGGILLLIFLDSWILGISIAFAFVIFTKEIYSSPQFTYEHIFLTSFLALVSQSVMYFFFKV